MAIKHESGRRRKKKLKKQKKEKTSSFLRIQMDNLIYLDELSEEIIHDQLRLRYIAKKIYARTFSLFLFPFFSFMNSISSFLETV